MGQQPSCNSLQSKRHKLLTFEYQTYKPSSFSLLAQEFLANDSRSFCIQNFVWCTTFADDTATDPDPAIASQNYKPASLLFSIGLPNGD
jgi:hypothetical protein